MASRLHCLRAHILSVLSVAIAGCGGNSFQVEPVSGNVTLQGKPVAGASVMLIPTNGGRPAMGETDEEGLFRLSTFGEYDGALVGEHRITVTKIEANSDLRTTRAVDDAPVAADVPDAIIPRTKIKWLVPQHYSQPDTSGLSATISTGKNELALSLK